MELITTLMISAGYGELEIKDQNTVVSRKDGAIPVTLVKIDGDEEVIRKKLDKHIDQIFDAYFSRGDFAKAV